MHVFVFALVFSFSASVASAQAVEDLPGYVAEKADRQFMNYLAAAPEVEQALRADEKLARCIMADPQLQRRLLLRREMPMYDLHCRGIGQPYVSPPATNRRQAVSRGGVRQEPRTVVAPPRLTARNLEDQEWAKEHLKMSYENASKMAKATRYKLMYMASTRDADGELLITREGKKEAARILAEARKPETQERAKQHLARARAERPSEKMYDRARAEIKRMVATLKNLKMPWD